MLYVFRESTRLFLFFVLVCATAQIILQRYLSIFPVTILMQRFLQVVHLGVGIRCWAWVGRLELVKAVDAAGKQRKMLNSLFWEVWVACTDDSD